MLLALWAKSMGHFFNVKFNVLGCIVTTRNLENQSQNPHRAICLLAISLRVQPLKEIWSDFAYCTKMLLAPFKYGWISDFENSAGSCDKKEKPLITAQIDIFYVLNNSSNIESARKLR